MMPEKSLRKLMLPVTYGAVMQFESAKFKRRGKGDFCPGALENSDLLVK
jgi:hypothetical protein